MYCKILDEYKKRPFQDLVLPKETNFAQLWNYPLVTFCCIPPGNLPVSLFVFKPGF